MLAKHVFSAVYSKNEHQRHETLENINYYILM